MIIQARVFLALLATVACADGARLRRNGQVSPTTNHATYAVHPPMRDTSPTTNEATTNTKDAKPPVERSPPSTTNNAISSTEMTHPPVTSPSTTTIEAITTTEEPPSPSSCFITDAKSFNILRLPENETVSRLLFWPTLPGITITLNVTAVHTNYALNTPTVLPHHWHNIDIYQPTSRQSHPRIDIKTEKRYINLDKWRVTQMKVGSDHPTHWCFCPHAHLCTLLSPLEQGGGDSSGKRTDLLAALLVVVFLLIVTLLALGGVTFYKKNELFHIYAKPIDCLPYTPPPPPLPKPNKESVLYDDEAKQGEVEKSEESGYSKVSGGANRTFSQIPPVTNTKTDKAPLEHESINSLYGLV